MAVGLNMTLGVSSVPNTDDGGFNLHIQNKNAKTASVVSVSGQML
jgi:hypothetical protein